MPLNIELKPNEKIFLNGAVLVNGGARAQLTLLNDAAILRERDILTDERADTPSKRLYFCVQLMYMDPASRQQYLSQYLAMRQAILDAAPSTVVLVAEIDAGVEEGSYYKALKSVRKLIAYEEELVSHVRSAERLPGN